MAARLRGRHEAGMVSIGRKASLPRYRRVLLAGFGAGLMLGVHAAAIADSPSEYRQKMDSLIGNAAFRAQAKEVYGEFIRKPSSSIASLCRAKFPSNAERDTCPIAALDDAKTAGKGGRGTAGLAGLRILYETNCGNSPFSQEALDMGFGEEWIKTTGGGCSPVFQRAYAIANGDSPKDCLEASWLSASTPDKTWAVRPVPGESVKYIAGELIHFQGSRYAIRQTELSAEMEQLQRNTASAAAMLNALGQRQSGPQQKFAVVEVSRATKTFNADSIQLSQLVEVIGSYRSNRTLTLTDGAQVPALVIQATCIEGLVK